MIIKYPHLTIAACLALAGLTSAPLTASQDDFDAIYDHSLGKDGVDYRKKNSYNWQSDAVFVDGSFKTRPINITNYDRSSILYTRLWLNAVLTDKLGIRLALWNKTADRKEYSTSTTGNKGHETWHEESGSLELTIHGKGGFELYGGAMIHHVAAHDYYVSNPSAEIKTEYGEVSVPVPHLGILRRSSANSFGFYYISSAQRDRTVTKTSEQDPGNTLVFSEPIHHPNTLALFFSRGTGKNSLYFEASLIRGSGGGIRSPEGDSIVSDHFRGRFIYYKPLGGVDLEASLTHRGHSFAQTKNTTLTTIAMTVLDLKFMIGNPFSHFFVGGVLGYGEGGQSSEEFDTLYKIYVFGASIGMTL